MRDAFGGVFTMNLLLVFIFIYVAFTAVSLNYAKAFRVKNAVIDFVEQNELSSLNHTYMNDKLDQLDEIVNKMSYNVTCDNIGATEGETKVDMSVTSYCYKGIKITFVESTNIEGTSAKKIKYKVSTGANWNLGALNKILALGGQKEDSEEYVFGSWTINGEANVVIKN